MNEEVKKIIAAVLNTLGKIEVRGEDNLDMMLGCIRALKSIKAEGGENDG